MATARSALTLIEPAVPSGRWTITSAHRPEWRYEHEWSKRDLRANGDRTGEDGADSAAGTALHVLDQHSDDRLAHFS
jgi:hypothetical protein